ncbi:hypothetical protein GCM10027030_10630 [Luteococcus sediminum]
MTNSPKKSVLVLVAAASAILCLGATPAQASPAPAGHHSTSHTHAVQATSSLTSFQIGQLGRSRILWCL